LSIYRQKIGKNGISDTFYLKKKIESQQPKEKSQPKIIHFREKIFCKQSKVRGLIVLSKHTEFIVMRVWLFYFCFLFVNFVNCICCYFMLLFLSITNPLINVVIRLWLKKKKKSSISGWSLNSSRQNFRMFEVL
jgi:hypothetical protein